MIKHEFTNKIIEQLSRDTGFDGEEILNASILLQYINIKTKSFNIEQLKSITSVVKNFDFFIAEKWKIASDKGGSGNTANIGSINDIEDIKNENGMFSKLGENWFDDYWMNYNKISIKDEKGKPVKIRSLEEFVKYRKGNSSLIVFKKSGRK